MDGSMLYVGFIGACLVMVAVMAVCAVADARADRRARR